MMIALILEEALKFKLLDIDYVDFWSWYEKILHYDFVKSLLEPESGMWLFECNLSPKLIKRVTIRMHGFVGVGTPLLKSVSLVDRRWGFLCSRYCLVSVYFL